MEKKCVIHVNRDDYRAAVVEAQKMWEEVDNTTGEKDPMLSALMMMQNFAFAAAIEKFLFGEEDEI